MDKVRGPGACLIFLADHISTSQVFICYDPHDVR
jgi:hypothetical protein